MDGLIKSTGESTEDDDFVPYLKPNFVRLLGVGIDGAYPIHLRL